MLCYKRINILLFLLLQSWFLSAIQLPTFPFVDNYTKHDYQAGTQNWNMVQDSNNKMYFANNNGILRFDGYEWQLCRVSNHSIVRSLCLIGGDTIMAGAYNDFGLVTTNGFGTLEFESWVNKIPEEFRNFQEVWRIHKMNDMIIIQTFNFMFVFKDGRLLRTFKPESNYKYSFIINDILYIQDMNSGLHRLKVNKLELLPSNDNVLGKEIWSILPFSNDKLLIGTQLDGLYVFDGEKYLPWDTEANDFLLKSNLFSAIQLQNGNYCFGSIQNGLIISDKKGKILTHQNTDLGLQNNTVLSVFEDEHSNLWLGLDNGIDYLKTSSVLQHISMKGGFGMGYVSYMTSNKLYAGTNQGLFYIDLNNGKHEVQSYGFNTLDNSIGQVWTIKELEGIIYCCHNTGLNIINDQEIESTDYFPGAWNIYKIPNSNNELLVGTYQGIWVYNVSTKQSQKLLGFNESARKIVFVDNNHLLVSHDYKGIYKLKIDWYNYQISIVDLYNGTKYLPNNYGNEIFEINNQILACTNYGIYEYKNNVFQHLPYWDSIIPGGASQVSTLTESGNNKIWCFKDGKTYFITYLNSEMYEVKSEPFLPIVNTFPHGYENVMAINDKQYLIGNEDGFILYNENYDVVIENNIVLDITRVYSLNKDSYEWMPLLLFTNENKYELGRLSFSQNHLKINLSIPYYQRQELVQIRYRNNNGPWSEWIEGNEVELNNLREGIYYTDIQCSIDGEEVLSENTIILEIAPPFYRTWQMYLVYLALFFSLALLFMHLVRKRIEKARRIEKITIERQNIRNQLKLKQEAELAQGELIKLRNESLRSDIRHKSKELANNTMSIINKNEVLQQIKEVLIKLRSDDNKLDGSNSITKLIKKVDKEIENKDNWTVFEQNFDKVHENFLKRLKESHDELTPKDLRLAAYLRMNLSSKEIAPLLNISVRSVEISRYRLRKKMNLEHDQNLTEYLIST